MTDLTEMTSSRKRIIFKLKFLSHRTGHEISGNSLPPCINKLVGCMTCLAPCGGVVGCYFSLTCRDDALDLTSVVKTETARSGIVQSFPCAVEDEVNRK